MTTKNTDDFGGQSLYNYVAPASEQTERNKTTFAASVPVDPVTAAGWTKEGMRFIDNADVELVTQDRNILIIKTNRAGEFEVGVFKGMLFEQHFNARMFLDGAAPFPMLLEFVSAEMKIKFKHGFGKEYVTDPVIEIRYPKLP